MLTQTKGAPLVESWFMEKMTVVGEGISVPFLVIDSETPSEAGISLIPLVEGTHDIQFYIKEKPLPGASISKDQLISGRLRSNFTLSLPPNVEVNEVFFHSAQIKVINILDRQVYGESEVKAGKNISFSFISSFDADACDDYYHLISGDTSLLHVMINVSFYVQSIKGLKNLEIIQPLSKVYQCSNLPESYTKKQIRFVYYDNLLEEYTTVPSFLHVNPVERRKARNGHDSKFMMKSNKIGTNLAILQPTSHIAAYHLANSPSITLNHAGLGILDNIIITDKTESLPVVEDQQANWFKDYKNKNHYWVLPTFTLVEPQLNDDPNTSPFRFLFNQIGMDKNGKPVLEGEITLSLSMNISQESVIEIKGMDRLARIHTIKPKDISIRMEIPYLEDNGKAKVSSIITEEFRWHQDTLSIVFRLTNEWIRVCYATLSSMGTVGNSKINLNLSFGFDGMGDKPQQIQQLFFAQNIMKIAALPVVSTSTRSKPKAPTYFDAKTKKLVLGDGTEMNFADQGKPRSAKIKPVLGKIATINKLNTPFALNSTAILPTVATTKITEETQNKNLIKRSYLKQVKNEVRFDCTKFGTFFQEKDEEGNITSIGCKEPYKLGEVKLSLYVPLEELAHKDYKLYQSTQSPNRFLVVPKRYVITRYEPDKEENAFQPCIHLYSTIDAENLERSRCVLAGTLAPDIARYELEDLHYLLSRFTPHTPYVSFPAEIEHEEVYQWGIPAQLGGDVESFSLGPFIHFTYSSKIETIMTLHSMMKGTGLSGLVKFTLPDESVYTSQVLISLDSVNGPFINGPLISQDINGKLHVKNGLTKRLQLTQMHAYKDYIDKLIVPVEKTLNGGEEFTFNKEADRIYVMQYQVEQTQENLDESRQYLEDIECQVIFITQIDFEKEKIKKLKIQFGLSHNDFHETELTKDKTVSEQLLLMPITNFFDRRELQYFITVEKEGTDVGEMLPWNKVSLAENGNIINITTSSILQP